MPHQSEVFLRDLEQVSDEAESALAQAMTLYLATHSAPDDEEDEDDLAVLILFLRSDVNRLVLDTIDLMERHAPAGPVSESDRRRIAEESVRRAAADFIAAGREDQSFLSGEASESRATRLGHVVTSVVSDVVSQVQLQVAPALGFTQKTWRTRLDQRVRTSHRILEGVTLPLDERFVSFDYTIAFPGDRTAPLHGRVNCRCRLRFSW